MKKLLFGLFVLTLSASPGWAAGLTLSIQDGKVSIDCQDVTIRQILTEWARLGKTRIINLERVNSGPITVKFDALPEKQALDIILRTVPGYMAAPRESYVAGASVYDRILIMATTTPVAARPQTPAFQGSPQARQPNVTQLRAVPPVLTPGALPENPADYEMQQDDPAIAAAAAAGLVVIPALSPGAAIMNPRASGPAAAPQPSPTATSPVTTPSNPWNAPIGTARPGLAPPPPPASEEIAPPLMRPRPPQADR